MAAHQHSVHVLADLFQDLSSKLAETGGFSENNPLTVEFGWA